MNSPETNPELSSRLEIVHQAVPGRLRLNVPGLKGTGARVRTLGDAVARNAPGLSVDIRPRTGSVIVGFDPATPVSQALDGFLQALHRARAGGYETGTTAGSGGSANDHHGSRRNSAPTPRPSGPAGHRDPPGRSDWHSADLDDILGRLDVTNLHGLPEAEAEQRRLRYGPNALSRHQGQSALQLFASQFKSLPVAMLAGSAVISMATGGVADAVATLSIVMVNGVLGYVTEGQAEKTISQLTAPSDEKTNVLRNGAITAVRVADVVPGDVLMLRPGTKIPADARIVEQSDLMVDESSLTGESAPVMKEASDVWPLETPLSDRTNMIYAGTLVAAGTGKALVVATGPSMELAQVQLLSEGSERPRAPIEDELDRLGKRLVAFSLLACGAFFAVGALRGYRLSYMFKDALALAVAAVPEGLPTVATSTLALGLKRMEKRGILIRGLDVVESLGALQTICLDKTGTLTANRMMVEIAVAGGSEKVVNDGFDAHQNEFRCLAEIAALNNDGRLGDDGQSVVGTSPTEQALLEFAMAAGIDIDQIRKSHPRLSTNERTSKRRFMTTVHDDGDGSRKICVKGSPDDLLERCRWQLIGSQRRDLTEEDRSAIRRHNEKIASRPARVLAFALSDDLPADDGDVADLTWVGIVGMVDPIRPGAKAFISALHTAGIETVLITGDQAGTAEAIARDLDLAHGASLQTIDSANLDMLDADLLTGLAKTTHVFARVNPREKLLIVRALQKSGRVVAMTGDGINDGPALKAANVGIAMGKSGTDLARDVANVVIVDDELPTLIEAIAQGRAIYRNIRRALEFLVATNMSEILVETLEAFHGPGELETPMELLWINLATDVAPGLGLALASPDEDAMLQPPRSADEPIIPDRDFKRMGLDSAVIAASAMTSHFVGLARYGAGPQTRGMTFLTLSIGQLLYTLGCQRSDPRKLRIGKLLENKTLDLSLLASIGFTALPFFVPPLRRLLGVAPVRPADLAISMGMAVVPLANVLVRRGIDFTSSEIVARP